MGEGEGSSLLPALLFLPSMFCKSKAVAKHSIDVNHQTFMQAKVLVIHASHNGGPPVRPGI